MLLIFFSAPLVGILTALAAVIAEQLLAVGANIFFQKEIVLDVYNHLGFFVIAAAFIEESFKYFAVNRVFRQIFSLKRFKFIFAALLGGLFFGITEIYFVLLSNGNNILDFRTLDGETLFSLLTVIAVHVLTILLIAVLIASRREETRLAALKTIIPPVFVHLFVNFLIIQKGDFTNWLIAVTLGMVFAVNLVVITIKFRKLD